MASGRRAASVASPILPGTWPSAGQGSRAASY